MLTGSVNGWYIGNILFGSVMGMLAVDPVTGAMYSFPEKASATLDAPPATKTSQAAQMLTIVSTESLAPEQMKGAPAGRGAVIAVVPDRNGLASFLR